MIAIIPARGGSKGLPGKNIKFLNGKPLIAYTIEAAKNSKYIDRVVVTTDDEKIAEIAKEYGAEIPFLRPTELASDTASAIDVYLHIIEYFRRKEEVNKFIVLLPTAPLRNEKQIDEAIEVFNKKDAETLISVREADVPVSWYYEKDKNDLLVNAGFQEDLMIANRQKNKKFYIPNGAIYILDYKLLQEKRTYYSDKTVGYVMSRKNSIDIDDIFDFKLAELIIQKNI